MDNKNLVLTLIYLLTLFVIFAVTMDCMQTVNIDKFNIMFNHFSENQKTNFWSKMGITYNTERKSNFIGDYIRENRHLSGCIMSIFLCSTLASGFVIILFFSLTLKNFIIILFYRLKHCLVYAKSLRKAFVFGIFLCLCDQLMKSFKRCY